MCLIFPEEVIQYKVCHLGGCHGHLWLQSQLFSVCPGTDYKFAQVRSAFSLLPVQIEFKQIPIKFCVTSTWLTGKYI